MKIEQEDYILSSDEGSILWDLKLNINNKWKDSGYGMPLGTCIRKIAKNRIANKGNVDSIEQFLKLYLTEIKKISDLL